MIPSFRGVTFFRFYRKDRNFLYRSCGFLVPGFLRRGVCANCKYKSHPLKDCHSQQEIVKIEGFNVYLSDAVGICKRCGYISSQPLCKACVLLEGLNKGLPRYDSEKGHFRVSRTLTLKTRLSAKTFHVKMSFFCMKMKNRFYINRFAPSLALKQRLSATRKWPIG